MAFLYFPSPCGTNELSLAHIGPSLRYSRVCISVYVLVWSWRAGEQNTGELQYNVAARGGLRVSSGPEHRTFCDSDLPIETLDAIYLSSLRFTAM